MALPAASYLSNSGRTVAEMKVAMEDQRDFIADMPGGAPRSTLSIAGGSITPPLGAGGGAFNVDTEALAASDDLTNCVLTNVPDGRYLRLYCANAGRVSTVKHAAGGTGQYLLRDSADLVLNATDKWVQFQRVGSDLIEVDRGYGVDYPGQHDFLRIAAVPAHNTLCPHSRLRLDYVTASTVTVAADAVVLSDASGRLKRFVSLSETLNIANTGANGRDLADNGGLEAASTWYHVWAIGKDDGTLDTWGAARSYPGSATSIYAILPSGYTWAGYLGAIRNDGASNLVDFQQRGDQVVRPPATALSGGVATSHTLVDLSGIIPQTARRVAGHAYLLATAGTPAGNFSLRPSARNTVGEVSFFHPFTTTGNGAGGPFDLAAIDQALYYYKSGSVSAFITVSGWTL